jgi:two-component system sensor histidine kinase PilS (NtrC family)
MLSRVIFSFLLLASTVYIQQQAGGTPDTDTAYTSVLYYLAAFIFALSLLYAAISRRVKKQTIFSYTQFAIDVFLVTLIVYITGGFFSYFSFLYLVVIIYTSMILYLRGGLFVATLGSIFYAILLALELTGVLPPTGDVTEAGGVDLKWTTVTYKILIITSACYAVALLSGLLTEQYRKSQNELHALEDHLERVEKMAYMGEMAAGLAHEIKNPLASLAGSIQLLKEDLRYDPDHERLMEIILRETDRLSTLVSDFLFFAKPPVGQPEKVHLITAINEVTDLFEKDTINARDIQLEKSFDSDGWVLIDPTHLSQVLWNLLLNAAEAIEQKGEIGIRTLPAKSKQIEIQICDNGCGMELEVARSIFDPFFTTKTDGTGLGLSITHRILGAYNSRLEVSSVPNKGTTFNFKLDTVHSQEQL